MPAYRLLQVYLSLVQYCSNDKEINSLFLRIYFSFLFYHWELLSAVYIELLKLFSLRRFSFSPSIKCCKECSINVILTVMQQIQWCKRWKFKQDCYFSQKYSLLSRLKTKSLLKTNVSSNTQFSLIQRECSLIMAVDYIVFSYLSIIPIFYRTSEQVNIIQ